MHRFLSKMLWGFVLLPLCLAGGSACFAHDAPEKPPLFWKADDELRDLMRFIRTDDVIRLEFSGRDMVGERPDGSGVLAVDDPKIIARFVLALREAEYLESPDPETGPLYRFREDDIYVFLKPNSKAAPYLASWGKNRPNFADYIYKEDETKGKYLRFRFGAGGPGNTLGRRFWLALHSLGKCQAAAIRAQVEAVKSQVVAYRFIDYNDMIDGAERVSNPAEVAAFVNALGQVDERAYEWDVSDPKRPMHLQTQAELELKDGRKIPIIILLRPPVPKAHNPEWLDTLYKSLRDPPPEAVH